MNEQPATLQSVTVAEAAAILGVSTATVRRMVKRGELEGQRVLRPQGSAFVVTVPLHATEAAADAAATRQPAGDMPRDNASAGAQLAAWSETFMLPLVAALERSQATVRDQAETIGTLRAENAALRAPQQPQAASGAPRPPDLTLEPPLDRWRTWAPWVLGMLALVAVVALLTWPR